ncbi:hypothetical protein A2U01_0067525, partial [Trifolium medium]|nr:hypothetical protein [Trifolium medium]
MGLNDAMDLAEKLCATNIVFETDSQIIVKAVKDKARGRKKWGAIVQRCINFLKRNPNSDILWVKWEGNQVAHELAKWAEQELNREWPNSVPN